MLHWHLNNYYRETEKSSRMQWRASYISSGAACISTFCFGSESQVYSLRVQFAGAKTRLLQLRTSSTRNA